MLWGKNAFFIVLEVLSHIYAMLLSKCKKNRLTPAYLSYARQNLSKVSKSKHTTTDVFMA